MPDTKMAMTGRSETAVRRSPVGRQPIIAIAGQAFAGTGIPFAEQRVNCDTTNN